MPATRPATGVMLMAYGAPATLDDVGDFFTHIRGGRRPPEERIEDLRRKYREIGGGEVLHRITSAQARALQDLLGSSGERIPVFVGMRHSPPFIHERLAEVAQAGVGRLVGLALAPHYSTLSVGAYHKALRVAAGSVTPQPDLLLVDSYHDHPAFIAALAEALAEALASFRREGAGPIRVVFTGHSLPERIVAAGEPYRDQLLTTARLVAAAVGATDWEFAFQSASPTGEPWLGPDVLDVIRRLASEGCREVLIAPVGFVSDHLEVLYDVDVLFRRAAEGAGMRLRRTASLNARPAFIAALGAIVRDRLRAAGPEPEER